MKMTKAICCEHCFHFISKKNQAAGALWLELCDLKILHGKFGLHLEDFKELALLEQLGFITTTETKNLILVRVNCEKYDADGRFFCGSNCYDT